MRERERSKQVNTVGNDINYKILLIIILEKIFKKRRLFIT